MGECDRSFLHYHDIIQLAKKEGYCFKTYQRYKEEKDLSHHLDTKICVLRHDVDLFPERSIEFAKIESQYEVQSTFFFRVHANEYNCLSYEIISLIKDIHQLGHEIGLHGEPVDIHKATGYSAQLSLAIGKQIIESITGSAVAGVASHNDLTPDNNLPFFTQEAIEDGGFLYEAYSDELNLFKKSYYITDSHPWYWRTYINGHLTPESQCLCQYLNKKIRLINCLTHPHTWYRHHYHRVKY